MSLATSRRHWLLWLSTLPLSSQAGFNFFTNEYTASRAELQAQIERRFPLEQRYADIISVRLHGPELGLDASAQRSTLGAKLAIASPWLRNGAIDGSVAVSSALRWDAEGRALRLDRPAVERLDLQGLVGGDIDRLRRIVVSVAQELLQGQALRTFTKEEMSFGLKTYDIGAITVLEDGIKVQLQ